MQVKGFRTLMIGSSGQWGAAYGQGPEPAATTYVFHDRDRAGWEEFWDSRINRDAAGRPTSPAPGVRWDEEIVIVAALGLRPSAAYGIRCDGLTLSGDFLQVLMRETHPHPETFAVDSCPSPWCAIATKYRYRPGRVAVRYLEPLVDPATG
jgi:hypothetical protein